MESPCGTSGGPWACFGESCWWGVEDSEDFEGCGAEGVGHARGDDARYAVAAAAAGSLNG
jgi:hypothetical protein